MLTEAHKCLTVVKERGKEGKPLNRVYRLIRKPEILLTAYMNLYPNKGAMTSGVDAGDTVDGMSMERIQELSEKLKEETHQWRPVRRVYIPKANGKLRPLGIPGWTDKMVQEAIRLVLEAYYEPQFSDLSHGFRQRRGCHTALDQVRCRGWTGTKWFIEGDIKGCFDNIDHDKLMEILSDKIDDPRFLKLIRGMLKAGYLEDWRYHQTYSGTPQGGVVSPLLSNIYLDKLDKYAEGVLIPEYTRGNVRKISKEYARLKKALERAKEKENRQGAEDIRKQMKETPFGNPTDPNFRRLHYVRYADDFLLGFTGPKSEAEEIKQKIAEFLRRELKLEMSLEKTLITHALSGKARFLNYEITIGLENTQQTGKRRALNGKPVLLMPKDVVKRWKRKFIEDGKVIHRKELLTNSDFDITTTYRLELNGIYNYYRKASNVSYLHELKGTMLWSLIKTIANKHQRTTSEVLAKHRRIHEERVVFETRVNREGKEPLTVRFGDISLKRDPKATLADNITVIRMDRTELLDRMMAEECELCGSKEKVQVHHIRAMKDLKQRWKGQKERPAWVQRMIAIKRKTLVVCETCHRKIHNGTYDGPRLTTVQNA